MSFKGVSATAWLNPRTALGINLQLQQQY